MIGAVFLLLAACFLGCIQKRLKKSGYIRFLYVFMILSGAGAVFIFLTGLVCVLSPLHIFTNQWTFCMAGWKAASGNMRFPFVFCAGCIWTAGVILRVCGYFRKQKSLNRLCMLNQPVTDVQTGTIFECAAGKTGLNSIPLLFSNEAVRMPFLKGILHPAVVMPARSLSPHEQMLVFCHELTHYKRHDLIWRYFQRYVLALYWFVPLRSFWMDLFVELQETLCDIDVCRSCGNSFSAKTYYMTILTMSAGEQEKTDSRFVSCLADRAGQLERRIGNMTGYRSGNRRKGVAAAVTAAGSLLFLFNIFAGICWPDIPANQNENITEIYQSMNQEKICVPDGYEEAADSVRNTDLQEPAENEDVKTEADRMEAEGMDGTGEKDSGCRLTWGESVVYHLGAGEKISSEVFRGEEGKNLILMAAASEGGYKVSLVSEGTCVFVHNMEEIESLNLELHNEDYRLEIFNTGASDIKIEMYCDR